MRQLPLAESGTEKNRSEITNELLLFLERVSKTAFRAIAIEERALNMTKQAVSGDPGWEVAERGPQG